MNEAANFVKGSVAGCPNNTYEHPPYKPRTFVYILCQVTLTSTVKAVYVGLSSLRSSMYGHSIFICCCILITMCNGQTTQIT